MDRVKKYFAIPGLIIILAMASGITQSAFAKDKAAAKPTPVEEEEKGAEQVDVNQIKEKYWAKGNQTEVGVVQNRLYSKERKFELGTFYGFLTSDPFLSMTGLGLNLGYHFSEYFSFHAMYMREFVAASTALIQFQTQTGYTTNTNNPSSFWGGEVSASVIYGKLSFIGKAIIYFDLHLLGGAGSTQTENGNYFTPFFGVGQQIYLNQWLTLRLDYRTLYYRETILAKSAANGFVIGQPLGDRTNWTNVVTFGFSVFIDPRKQSAAPPN